MVASCRARAQLLPTQPATHAALVVAPPWSLTSDSRQLLLANNGLADKILVFCTNENFNLSVAVTVVE